MVTKRKKNSNYKSGFLTGRLCKEEESQCQTLPPKHPVRNCAIFGVSACMCLQGNQGRSYGGVWVSEMETQLTHVNMIISGYIDTLALPHCLPPPPCSLPLLFLLSFFLYFTLYPVLVGFQNHNRWSVF